MTDEPGANASVLGQYAGFTTRLLAYVVDRLILAAMLGIYGAAVAFADAYLELDLASYSQVLALVVAGILIAIAATIVIGYYIGFWMAAGQTPGKRLMGARIVRTDEKRLNLWNCVRRLVGYVISNILFLGYLWVLVDNRRRAWHDHLAGTYVIYAWPEIVELPSVRERVRDFRRKRGASEIPDPSES